MPSTKHLFILLLVYLLFSCDSNQSTTTENISKEKTSTPTTMTPKPSIPAPKLDLTEANRLAKLPLTCMETEYPNKLGQVLSGAEDLKAPSILHPAFYGCFDWHSAVHGHWSLVRLLKEFPNLENAEAIKQKLAARISKENILQEVDYFKQPQNKSYERTYGWAWLLKLAEELHTWDTPFARELENNLQPLTNLIVDSYLEFLPKLYYPIRIGTHTNTGFGLTFAYDYAATVGHNALKDLITNRAKDFFLKDENGPLEWEPGGYDFLSPCLEEIDIMRRVLPKEEFADWLQKFLPQLSQSDFKLEPGIVSDRTDGHLVHLDGVNFSRAWCLYGIAQTLPEYAHLETVAHQHIHHSLPEIVDGHYEGGHWLASFAIYALGSQPS
ncbi:DUF2891 domain-containing protein [Aureispira sp. CCB-E]|uniref:DUF2891 domain-containing protein n=1 Tax=Aureispira sp. CCB-E TaxID=3051121 RepID=UPI0028697C17|nr:DUF2891 domain-containing protein [Aureispira sp. CCB-E]WMX13837.1 DUF2891 domain-containing protein [Aureispira sp. CCB-E]